MSESKETVCTAEKLRMPNPAPTESIDLDRSFAVRTAPTQTKKFGIRFERALWLTEWERPAFYAIINDGRYLMHILEREEYAQDDDRFRDFMAYVCRLFYPGTHRVCPELKAKLQKMNKLKYRCAFPNLVLPRVLENGRVEGSKQQREQYSAIMIQSRYFQNIVNMKQ